MRIMMRTLLTLCLGCCALAALFPGVALAEDLPVRKGT